MDYQKIYNQIISRGKSRVLTEYKEIHHIIPRCMGGTDDLINLVELTPEEHYTCHQLLVKMYPSNHKLVNAALFMTANGMGRRSNKVYGWLKRRYSEYMSGSANPNKNGQARRKYIEKYGVPEVDKSYITSDWCKDISERMKGENNPCAGIKPWNHPRATSYSKSVWKQANELYSLWINNSQPSYSKLYYLANGKCYTNESKVIGPYMNIVKYFRNGWVPTNDTQWKEFNVKTTI